MTVSYILNINIIIIMIFTEIYIVFVLIIFLKILVENMFIFKK
jgi:hypothetical protein